MANNLELKAVVWLLHVINKLPVYRFLIITTMSMINT